MQIVIDIPKEFEKHFNSDRFEDSLSRVRFDIYKSFIGGRDIVSGRYEIETLDMITEAFLNSNPLSKGHGDLIDRQELLKSTLCKTFGLRSVDIENAPTIIEAEREDEKCHWMKR